MQVHLCIRKTWHFSIFCFISLLQQSYNLLLDYLLSVQKRDSIVNKQDSAFWRKCTFSVDVLNAMVRESFDFLVIPKHHLVHASSWSILVQQEKPFLWLTSFIACHPRALGGLASRLRPTWTQPHLHAWEVSKDQMGDPELDGNMEALLLRIWLLVNWNTLQVWRRHLPSNLCVSQDYIFMPGVISFP